MVLGNNRKTTDQVFTRILVRTLSPQMGVWRGQPPQRPVTVKSKTKGIQTLIAPLCWVWTRRAEKISKWWSNFCVFQPFHQWMVFFHSCCKKYLSQSFSLMNHSWGFYFFNSKFFSLPRAGILTLTIYRPNLSAWFFMQNNLRNLHDCNIPNLIKFKCFQQVDSQML